MYKLQLHEPDDRSHSHCMDLVHMDFLVHPKEVDIQQMDHQTFDLDMNKLGYDLLFCM